MYMYIILYASIYVHTNTHIISIAHLKQIDVEGESILEGGLPPGGHINSSPPLGTDVHGQRLHSLQVHVAGCLELL